MPVSIVIISLNEADIIERCLIAASKITDDIVVIDSGSTDDTIAIAKKYTSKVFIVTWQGYGPTRNIGADKAKYDWIFSLDCDEIPDADLINNIIGLEPKLPHLYKVGFRTHLWGKAMKFSGMTRDFRRKIYHRKHHQWNDNEVHERLTKEKITPCINLNGKVDHYSYNNYDDMYAKFDKYAQLAAKQLIEKNLNPGFIKEYFAAPFRFIKTYFLQLGFLDGKHGWLYAKASYLMVRNRYLYYRKQLK